jgi:hypothetical protein
MNCTITNSMENNVSNHNAKVDKRDAVRRALMMVSHHQQAGRNFLCLPHDDMVPDFVNVSADTDTVNLEDLTVMEDDLPCHNISDLIFNQKTSAEAIEKSTHRRAIFAPSSPKRYANTTIMIPPSQRVDTDDSKIALLPPTPESNVLCTNEGLSVHKYEHAVGDERKQIEYVVVNDLHEKLKAEYTSKVRVPRRGMKPVRRDQLLLLQQANDSDQLKSMNEEIIVLPVTTYIPENAKKLLKQSSLINDHYEGSTLRDDKQQRSNYSSTDMLNGDRLQMQPPRSVKYGKKATCRSLISMNSLESSMDSLLSSSVGGGSSFVISRAESMGVQSMLSAGSTAHELDYIVAVTTTPLVRTSTICSLDPVPETTTTDVPVCVRQKSCSKDSFPRPSNPMAISLLQYQTSITTFDSTTTSRMSLVSSPSIGSPPPIIMQSGANLSPILGYHVNQFNKPCHEHYHHQHYGITGFREYQDGTPASCNAQRVLPLQASSQVNPYSQPIPMLVDNFQWEYRHAFSSYDK